MAKRLAGLTTKKRTPQDATRKKDVDPIRRRVEALELRLQTLEDWAGNLYNPDNAPKSFERRKVGR